MRILSSTFEFLGPVHIFMIFLPLVSAFLLTAVVRLSRSSAISYGIRWTLAILLLTTEFSNYGYTLYYEGPDSFLQEALPLHACGVSIYLTAYMLVTKKQIIYDIVYFWGLAGATQAILTPALQEGPGSFRFFHFFVIHGGIVVGVLFATLGMKMRPHKKGLWIAYILAWIMMFFTASFNYLFHTNYMYLCEPPAGKSPFYFLPWPWYIPFLGLLALVFFMILWLPFCKSSDSNAC